MRPAPHQATPRAGKTLSPRRDFRNFSEALAYAAQGREGYNYYSSRASLEAVLPYGEMLALGELGARALVRLGAKPGDRVAVIAETTPEFAIAAAAGCLAGAITVPLPPPGGFGRDPAYVAQLRRMLETAAPVAVLAPEGALAELTEAAGGASLLFAGTARELSGLAGDPRPLPEAGSDWPVCLQFSSGSTREPTGALITHAALMENIYASAEATRLAPDDHLVSWLPLNHDMGLIAFFWGAPAIQCSLDYLDSRDFVRRPLGWLRLLSGRGGTVSFSPTRGYELCLHYARLPGNREMLQELDLSLWRVAGVGADMARRPVLEAFAQLLEPFGFSPSALTPGYGLAEATLGVTLTPAGRGMRIDTVDSGVLETRNLATRPETPDAATSHFVTSGKPLRNLEIRIGNSRGKALPERHVGEIQVRGPSLMREYFRKPGETAAALPGDGWLRTGDLGYLCQGELVVTGRKKDMMIVNGRNLWPQDLEWNIEEAAGLRSGDCAIFSIPGGGDQDERIVMIVRSRREAGPEDAFRKKLSDVARQLAGAGVEVVLAGPERLPRTTSGKLRRALIRENFLAGKYGRPVIPGPGGDSPAPRQGI